MSWDKPLTDQIIDQAGHFLWASVALAPILWIGEWWSGALSGFLIGLPREIVDQWPIGYRSDYILDLIFFTIGGAFMGILFLS